MSHPTIAATISNSRPTGFPRPRAAGPLWPPDHSLAPSSPPPSFAPLAYPFTFPVSSEPDSPRYRDVWWVLDPQHHHHCSDCQLLAANSPHTLATLYYMPGDGHTFCGPDCTCILSVMSPEQTYPPGPLLSPASLTPLQRLLRVYTHGQVWYLALSGAIPVLLASPTEHAWPHPATIPEATRDQARLIPPDLY